MLSLQEGVRMIWCQIARNHVVLTHSNNVFCASRRTREQISEIVYHNTLDLFQNGNAFEAV